MDNRALKIICHEVSGPAGRLGRISLNRPAQYNVLDHEMVQLLQQKLESWRKQDAIHAIIIDGMGEHAFCAGGDLKFLYQQHKNGSQAAITMLSAEYQLNRFLDQYPKPIVVIGHGYVMGGGLGIALHGQYLLLDKAAQCAMPEVHIGFFPDVGSRYTLGNLAHHLGWYMALTGLTVSTEMMISLGLARAKLEDGAEDFLHRLQYAPWGEKAAEDILEALLPPVVEPSFPEWCAMWSKLCLAATQVDDLMAALQGIAQPWAEKASKAMLKASPSSLNLTFALLQSPPKSLSEALEQDYQLAQTMFSEADFLEGIVAKIIEKRTPRWLPALEAEFFIERSRQCAKLAL
jgi:enoyl-CoA hydratase